MALRHQKLSAVAGNGELSDSECQPLRLNKANAFTYTGFSFWHYLNSPVRGQYYYLYLVLDVYSRKIVAWEIHEKESAEYAASLIRKACMRHQIGAGKQPLILHSDNGSPMKGATMLSTLQQLGVVTSFSRPRVSNDNPYSESIFKTLKYRPGYPSQAHESLESSRRWVHGFVNWYNSKHKHSGLKFQTPDDRHNGRSKEKVNQRTKVYQAAKKSRPDRWGQEIDKKLGASIRSLVESRAF